MIAYAAFAALAAAALVYALGHTATSQAARYEIELTRLSQRDFAQLFLFVEPKSLVRMSAAVFAVVLGVVWATSGSVAMASVAALATWVLPFVLVRWLRARRNRLILKQLPDALDAWSMSLRSGMALNQAIAQLANQQPAPIGQEFALVNREQKLGRPLDEAMQSLAVRVPLREAELLVTTVRIARETGGGLAESLDRLADSVRRKLTMEGKIRALTAQGKIQGIVVAALPVVVLLSLHWLQPETMRLMWSTPIGWATAGVIVVLEIVGFLLIRRIVRIDI
jgi:tight adherence protein B